MKLAHPTPWRLVYKTMGSDRTIVDANGDHVAELYSGALTAQRIVDAINAHEDCQQTKEAQP